MGFSIRRWGVGFFFLVWGCGLGGGVVGAGVGYGDVTHVCCTQYQCILRKKGKSGTVPGPDFWLILFLCFATPVSRYILRAGFAPPMQDPTGCSVARFVIHTQHMIVIDG